ncbi:hypothetical protein E1287_37645 [Actinomadura sp. KC06]|uniref:hypothetical protein n=1 Tax=Actinomadura sp. KC06 TaxID=2530369 RepID=UPI0010499B1E|nr:hypothetical protein [Actinomadura sp. KC06]TDD25058.1 hypothetical protein E1287_37645 [Actinomadura sp. KC06]
MAIGFRDAVTAYTNGATSNAIVLPGSLQAGDYVLVFGALSSVSAGDQAIASSTGGTWAPLGPGSVDDTNLRTRVWAKVLEASDLGATITLSWTSAVKHSMGAVAYSGVDATSPIDGTPATAVEAGTDTTHDAPGVTPSGANRWVVDLVADRGAADTTITAPDGRTERAEQLGNSLGTTSLIIADSDGPVTGGVASGPSTYTFDQAQANAVGWSIALTPQPEPTFPHAPLDVRAELLIDGAWVETIDKALKRDPVTITRGRSNEASRPDPSKAKLSLRDQEGKWAGRNPRSPYFGLLGRNTPLRIRVGDAPPYAYMPGQFGHYISTPDTAALDITGDIDVRADVAPDSWRPSRRIILVSKYLTGSGINERSWFLQISADGTAVFAWSTNGTLAAVQTRTSTEPVPFTRRERGAVRATLDVNNGAGQHVVTFYTAATIDGPWTQLGDPVTTAGTTSIYAGTAALEIASVTGGTFFSDGGRQYHGRVYAAQVRNGIDGTTVGDPGIAGQTEGDTSWTGPDGLTWTAHGRARLLRPARGHFEVASWPPSWHVSGNDVHVQVQAAGIRRRLGQGAAPVQSPLRRSIPATAGVVAYWPMEDAGGGFASGLAGAPALRVTRNPTAVEYQADTDFVGSAALPRMGTSRLVGTVPAYTPPNPPGSVINAQSLMMLLHLPDSALGGTRQIASLSTTGTAARWDMWYSTSSGGTFGVTIYDNTGTQIVTATLVFSGSVQGRLLRVAFKIQETATDINATVEFTEQGRGIDSFEGSGQTAFGSWTIGSVRSVTIGDPADLGDTSIGHVTLYNLAASPFDLVDEFEGYAGEVASARMARLAAENEIPLVIVGELDDTVALGAQRTGALLELLDQAADADGGILHESRDELGLEYRTRASLYNQARTVTLDYTARGEVPPPLTPTEDDQATRNDVTATRDGGSSARVVREDGPLSVLPPEEGGVGIYDEEITLGVYSDEQLPGIASWRVHLGTWDEARYPTVVMWPHTASHLLDDMAALDVGDRFSVTNPPPWLPPEDIDQLMQGYTEVLKPWSWEITTNASPAGPWTVGVRDSSRRGTAGSELAAPVDADDTSWSVATTTGPLWTTDVAEFPFDLLVGGERVTVTAITGASSPQAFTVVRSANGISKSHNAGAPVQLAAPAIRAL